MNQYPRRKIVTKGWRRRLGPRVVELVCKHMQPRPEQTWITYIRCDRCGA